MKTLAVVLATLALPANAAAQSIELICAGVARTTEARQTFGSVYSDGDSASGSATTYYKARSEELLRIRIDTEAGAGKVRLPAALIPPISVGKDGWWDFVKLEITEGEIRGQISLNFINKPKINIDRRTGLVDLKGYGSSFSGSCEKAPDAAAEPKF